MHLHAFRIGPDFLFLKVFLLLLKVQPFFPAAKEVNCTTPHRFLSLPCKICLKMINKTYVPAFQDNADE